MQFYVIECPDCHNRIIMAGMLEGVCATCKCGCDDWIVYDAWMDRVMNSTMLYFDGGKRRMVLDVSRDRPLQALY
jgi:hypothetical protein